MAIASKNLTKKPEFDLVLLHGWGVNQGVFTTLKHSLDTDFNVKCIDLPGYGEHSTVKCTPYDLATVSAWVASQLSAKTVIVGWSLGGLVAKHIAIHAPENVIGLITIASSPRFVEGDDWKGIAPKVLTIFQQQLKHDYVKTLDRFLAIQMMGANNAKAQIRTLKQNITQFSLPDPDALAGGLNILAQANLLPYLGEIKVPMASFFGEKDTLVPSSVHQYFKKKVARYHGKVYSEASHAPFIADNTLMAKDIKNELERMTSLFTQTG